VSFADVKARIEAMPKEDTKGIKRIVFEPPRDKHQKGAWAQFKRGKKEVSIFAQPSDGVQIDGQDPVVVREHVVNYVIPHEVGHHKALRTGKTDEDVETAEARADANVVGLEPYDEGVEALKQPPKEDEDWSARPEEDANQYVRRSLRGSGRSADQKMRDFSQGVRNTLFHPINELDKEWCGLERAAGKDGIPAADRMERVAERGAALVGRVITQANAEPLIDKGKGRNFRGITTDIIFGRNV
jgi:hypothetical protein